MFAVRLIACLTIFASVANAQPRPVFSSLVREFIVEDAPVIALRGVRVVDGTGSAARENQTIVIRDGQIAAVGRTGEVAIPAGAKVHDLAGTTVILAWSTCTVTSTSIRLPASPRCL